MGNSNYIRKLYVLRNGVLALIAVGAITSLAFNNCSEVEFASTSPSGLGSDPIVREIIKNCDDAARAGTLKTQNQNIIFDNTADESGRPGNICRFGVDGNADMNEGTMQARYDQSRRLNLPTNAVICDVDMSTDLQAFRYDDVFFFTFNGVLLASNNKTAVANRLTPVPVAVGGASSLVPVYKYSWAPLLGHPFENVADDYCLGRAEGFSTCSWPVSEQSGSIKFDFDRELLIRLSAAVPALDQTFGFTITGDNNPSVDCFHEELAFSMSVKYYLK